jgi:hypothetical protein
MDPILAAIIRLTSPLLGLALVVWAVLAAVGLILVTPPDERALYGLAGHRFAPYGFREAPGGRLEPDAEEQAVIAAALRASGLSLRARVSRGGRRRAFSRHNRDVVTEALDASRLPA